MKTAALACALVVLAACGDDQTPVGGGGSTTTSGGGRGGSETTANVSLTDSTATGLPETFTVRGVVLDEKNDPVEGALVLQGGGGIQFTTGADGSFEVEIVTPIAGVPVVVAAKIGYRSAGVELEAAPDADVTLQLRSIRTPDNASYEFHDPGTGELEHDVSTAYCGHCHTTFAADFHASAHQRSTKNPRLQDLYAGVASASTTQADCAARGGVLRQGATPGTPDQPRMRCYVGDGVLPDLNACPNGSACDDPELPLADAPTEFGACADCHAAGMDGPAGGRNLLDATGIGFEHGTHCDACHHVRDIDLDAPPGTGGRLVMQRPNEHIGDEVGGQIRQALFGPLPDVPNSFMGGSYQPKFATAEFCAGCHDQRQAALLPGATLAARFSDGLPTHTTYTEWLEGPYPEEGRVCQDCHMPPLEGMFNSVDISSQATSGLAGGFERDPQRNRSHRFRGPLTKQPAIPKLIDGAVSIDIELAVGGGALDVQANLTNVGCGHAIPTGEPMRALVAVVRAEACGVALSQLSGETIPALGGSWATGIAGNGLSSASSTLTWPAGAGVAAPGMRIRVVRPTNDYWDYDGIGLFEGSTLTPEEKGLERSIVVGIASVTSINGADLMLDSPLTLQAGDIVYLGDETPDVFEDGESLALAGVPGAVLARVMRDPDGGLGVPHYRAVDIASDNRIGPKRTLTVELSFDAPVGCSEATVSVNVLYRPFGWALARERGWDAQDYVVSAKSVVVPLP